MTFVFKEITQVFLKLVKSQDYKIRVLHSEVLCS
jgi:hypothetical protein